MWMDGEFLALVDLARRISHEDRSAFIRKAIGQELRRRGIRFRDEHLYAPDRAGIAMTSGGHIQIATGHARIHNGGSHVTTTKKTRTRKSKIG